jgi:hypothetical protein
MRFGKVLFITSLILLTLAPLSFVSSETKIENEDVIVFITINDAYYYTADEDGVENDIAAHFTLDVSRNSHSNGRPRIVFYIYLELFLPSGTSFLYLFKVTSPRECCASPTAYFYNHATESGWYSLEITGVLTKGDPALCIGTETFHFDPPGSTGGSEPPTCMIIV